MTCKGDNKNTFRPLLNLLFNQKFTLIDRDGCEGWGRVQFRERSERKFFLTPHLWLTWGGMKQDIAVFYCNYDV